MNEISLISAFVVGLLSGVHCLGMCGGITSALSIAGEQKVGFGARFLNQLLYNLGRIGSYTLAGVIFGFIGQFTLQASGHGLHQQLQTVTAVLFILMGLYLGNWWRVLSFVERAGSVVWNRIKPFAQRFLPIRKPHHAFMVGLLWGWLPCGLVYSMLISSIGMGSALQGGLLLLSFGLGTLPNLLLIGVFATQLQRIVRKPLVRHIAGLLVIAIGVYLIYDAWWLTDHSAQQGHEHH